jgi:Aromatic-ring hydroxylase, C-terminal
MRQSILVEYRRNVISDGIALGYRYDASPLILGDGTPPPPDTISEYHPTARPGGRAPHAWLTPDRSIIDLFGKGFVLLRLGQEPPDSAALEAAFADAGAPLATRTIADPAVAALYERRLVLVRPDGHVAWRSDLLPENPKALADRVRGVAGKR